MVQKRFLRFGMPAASAVKAIGIATRHVASTYNERNIIGRKGINGSSISRNAPGTSASANLE
jgi:hypothetical protein